MALELTRKKDGAGKAKTPGQKSDIVLKIMELFEKNPFLKILIPVLLFLILAGIICFVIFGDGVLMGKNVEPSGNESLLPASNAVDVLPGNNQITDDQVLSVIQSDPLSEDVLAKASYHGYVSGSSGLKTALIQIGSNTDILVLAPGETVGDSKWELAEITADYVVFKAGDNTKKITID